MAVPSLAARTLQAAATRRLAVSSALPRKVLRTSRGPLIAPVAAGYERSLRPCEARVSRLASTIYSGGDR